MKNVEIYLGGLKISAGEATPQEVSELKKLLEQQIYKIHWTAPTYYPWTTPYYQQPYYSTTSTVNTTSIASWNGDPKTNGTNSTTCNDQSCIASNGMHVQNLNLTN